MMQDARTRTGVAIVAVLAVIAIIAGMVLHRTQAPAPIVITQSTDPIPPPATFVASGGLRSLHPHREAPGPRADASDDPQQTAPSTIYVHVAGAVNKPSVYALSPGARVYQAIKAAGGAKPDADEDAVNLAEKLSDGEKVYLPTKQEMRSTAPMVAAAPGNDIGEHSVLPADAASSTAATSAKAGRSSRGHSDKLTDPAQGTVDINTADAGQLQRLPGVGPAMAARILAFRHSAGGFKKPEELMEVSGIGPKKYAKLETLVRIR